jgi:hypothetical protein
MYPTRAKSHKASGKARVGGNPLGITAGEHLRVGQVGSPVQELGNGGRCVTPLSPTLDRVIPTPEARSCIIRLGRPVRRQYRPLAPSLETRTTPVPTYAYLMVQTVAEPDEAKARAPSRRGTMVAIVLAVVVGIVLGYLGWVLPSPGGSLVVPTLIVFGIGAVLAGCSWILACFEPRGSALRTFAGTVGILSLAAAAWTFWFSLPAAMWSDSGANQQAQTALVRLSHEPKRNGVPIKNCWTIETGSVGPLGAPYRECAISTTVSGQPFVDVSFVTVGSPDRSIAYTNSGNAFLDSCVRHLIGSWWMTIWDHRGLGNCPIGYQFHGGP